MFIAAYSGSSMNPTLREPEMVEVRPYGTRPVRPGDVVLFLPPNAQQPVIHRVVRNTPAGISTRGDNNAHEDAYLVPPASIQGRVEAVWRGQKRRKIPGGRAGRLVSRRLGWLRGLYRGAATALLPVYRALSRWGGIARMVPVSLRPRVVVFHVRGRNQFQILLGRRIVGRYDGQRNQWRIQRPFHLLVDAKVLPRQPDRNRLKRAGSSQRNTIIDELLTMKSSAALTLADGSRWEITAGDEAAAALVSQLGRAMRLREPPNAGDPSPRAPLFRLLVQMDAHRSMGNWDVPLASENNGVVLCLVSPSNNGDGPHLARIRLSLVFAREAQARGGLLIHGALAEKDRWGVILAAPGGTGKTTASNRLPAPWRSLSDDATLVVRDPQGRYQAHPWPTWSRFQNGGAGGAWDVQHAVPLKGIFVLARADEDRAERVGPGHAVSMLVECAGQAAQYMPLGLFPDEIHAMNLERFDNLCALAQAVPAHVLHISRTGAFWQEIERSLEVRAP